MPRERTGHSKHPLPTIEGKTTQGHHQMVNIKIRLIIFSAAKDGEALYSQQKQDQELTVVRIMNSLLPNRLKLKKVKKTTRPLWYDLNQIPYDYSHSESEKCLIDRVPDELWMVLHDIVQEIGIKTVAKKKKCKKKKKMTA